MSRNRQHLKLKQRRARAAKLKKLHERYSSAASSREKDKIRAKLTKLAPYLEAHPVREKPSRGG